MEHLVTFKTAEGRDGNHVAATLDDALLFIERVHNAEEASDIRLHRMHEVAIEFKTYVKAEVRGVDAPASDTVGAEPSTGEQPTSTGPEAAAGSEASEQSSRRLFNRS